MGLLERHGEEKPSKDRARVVPDTKKATLQAEVEANAAAGATVYTDELASYNGSNDDYSHFVINHAETYVKDHIHSNGAENFWSFFKQCIHGTYVSIEPPHLNRYVDEEAFRFNDRTLNDGERFVRVMAEVQGRRVMYKDLIGEDGPKRGRLRKCERAEV